MTGILGKRKRRTVVEHESQCQSASDSSDDIRDRFKKAFEARFKPLKQDKKVGEDELVIVEKNDDDDDDDDSAAWSGLSDDEPTSTGIEVVEHNVIAQRHTDLDQQLLKTFMSSKPPTTTFDGNVKTKQPSKGKSEDDDDGTDASNLKNDLALQRLLNESHLLETDGTASSGQLVGRNRIKALDLRLQALGAKKDGLTQRNMPMAVRKGLTFKTKDRDNKRRKDAKENGVILERATKGLGLGTASSKSVGTVQPRRKRLQEIGAPSVGKFRNGALTLSKSDIQGMQGRGDLRRDKQRSGGKFGKRN